MKSPGLKIATYNLQKCVGLDLRRRPGRSLSVLSDLAPDVAVLQEADKRMPPRPAALPHGMAEAEGWRVVDFGEHSGSLGWHGNAILLRGPVGVSDAGHIELPGLEPRGAVRADLDTAIGPVRVVGAHLGLIRRYRLLQLAAIRRALALLDPMPTVICGDFNEWGDPAPLQAQLGPYRLLPGVASYPAPRPLGELDRFAISPELIAEPPRTHRAQPARIASDHLPVWTEVRPA